jgi:polysaccharide export outer membrane protein
VVPGDFVKLKLSPGFLVNLSVLYDSDFTGSYRIDEQGDLTVPIIGTLHVAGETLSEARAQIQRKLVEDQLLKDPQVDLMVLEYAAPDVTIMGEVSTPGKYPLPASGKLLDVLSLAGGVKGGVKGDHWGGVKGSQ